MKNRRFARSVKITILLVLLSFIAVPLSPVSVLAQTGAAEAGSTAGGAGAAGAGAAGAGAAAGMSTLTVVGIIAGAAAVLAIGASAISGQGDGTAGHP